MNHPATSSLKRFVPAVLVLALSASPALALPRGQGGGGASGTTRQPTASQGARKALEEAQAQLKLANDARTRARMRVEVAMKSSRPEWQAAQKEHDKAAADLATAQRQSEAKLKTSAEYKAAVKAWTDADTKYKALEQDPKGNQSEMEALHQQRTAQVLVMRKLQADAAANDPKLIDAKARLAEAKAKVDSFKSDVDAAAQSDPEYVATFQQVTAAEQQVATARQALVDAQKADGAARAAEAKARAEAAKAKAKSKSSGGPSGAGGY